MKTDTKDTTYNGWTNYETWVVGLWIDNDESTQTYWQEAAQQAYDDTKDTLSANARLTGVEPFTRKERAAFELRDLLKEQHEEALPELEGFAADLLNAALGEVNWHEIALSLLDSVEEDTEEETAD